MDNESVISLLLKVHGQETLEALRRSTAEYREQIADLPRRLAAGEIGADEFTAAQARMGRELERQTRLLGQLERAERDAAAAGGAWGNSLRDVDAAARDATASTGRLAAGAGKAEKATSGFGQSALQAGRIVQDFQAAGVMGIANNLEQLAMALGGGAGLAGALTLAATAYMAFRPQIEHLVSQLVGGGGGNALPDAAARSARALDALSDRLAALNEKQSLTNQELAEYVRLSASQVRLEDEKEEALAKRADRKRLLERERPEKEEGEKEAAKLLQHSLGGQQDDLIEGVRGTLRSKEADAAGKRFDEARETALAEKTRLEAEEARPRELGLAAAWERSTRIDTARRNWESAERDLETARTRLAIEEKKLTERAQDVVADAIERGRTARLETAMEAAPGAFTDQQRTAVQWASPRGREAWREIGEGIDADVEDAKREEAEAKEAKAAKEKLEKAEKDRNALVEKTEAETRRMADANRAERTRLRLEDEKAFDATVGEEVKRLGGGGLDEAAAAAAAQYRFEGGYRDRFGRPVRLDPEQQTQALGQDLSGIVGRTDPDMAVTTRDAVARKMAEDAMRKADQAALERRSVGMSDQAARYMALESLQNDARKAAVMPPEAYLAPAAGPTPPARRPAAAQPQATPATAKAQAAADQAQALMDAFDSYGQMAAAAQDAGSNTTAATQAAMAKAFDALQGALGRIERLEAQARGLDQLADGLTARARSPQRRGR